MTGVIPDRYKRAALLAATGWLPHAARVATRRRVLWAFQSAVTRRADTVIAVHPKSGGTWLRAMMFRVYQQKYGLSSRRVFKTDELARVRPHLPRYVISNGYYSYEAAVSEVLESGGVDGPEHLILMARHPGDIVVSWYRQFTQRISPRKRELIVREMRQPIDYRQISFWSFIMNEEVGLPALIDYHNRWAERIEAHPHGLIVRYEDLRAEPETHLRRIFAHIGEPVGDDLIAQAVEFASFDNMRQLEAENYFPNSSLRQKRRGSPGTVKVRRGKVGGFRDDLSPEQADIVDRMVAERLDPVFGYEA